MNRVILSPEYFGDPTIGRPISGAQIYVGIPDLDPTVLANQKQLSVQQESGVIVQVTQPVFTGAGGYPVYDGGQVTLLVSGDYSLTVLDSLGAQKSYVPSQVSVAGTLQTIESFGAVGDGVTDDTQAVLDAIAANSLPISFTQVYLVVMDNSNAQTILSAVNRFAVTGQLNLTCASEGMSMTSFVDIHNPYAVNIDMIGADTTDATIVSIGAVTGSAGAWSVPITVDSLAGIVVGGYVQVVTVGLTGTGRYKEAAGTWKVTAAAAGVVTMKNTHQQAAWPTMALTGGTVRSIPSILSWAAGSRGIAIYGCSLNSMSNLVIAGSFNSGTDVPSDGFEHGLEVGSIANFPETSSTDSHAIAEGSVYLDNVSVVDWPNKGLSVSGGKVVSSSGLSCCGNGWRGSQAVQNGSILGKFGSYSGNGASGAESEGSGFNNISGSICAGNLTDGILAIDGEIVFASSGYSGGNVEHGINVKNVGYVSANSAHSEGNTLNGVNVDMGVLDFGASSISTGNTGDALSASNGAIINTEGSGTIDDFNVDTDSGAIVIQTGGDMVWPNIVKYLSKTTKAGARFTASTIGDLVIASDATGAGTFTDRLVLKSSGTLYPDTTASDLGRITEYWGAIYANNIFSILPVADPGVTGQLWNNSGVVNVSA